MLAHTFGSNTNSIEVSENKLYLIFDKPLATWRCPFSEDILRKEDQTKTTAKNWNKEKVHLKVLKYSPLRCSRCNHSYSLICMLTQSL